MTPSPIKIEPSKRGKVIRAWAIINDLGVYISLSTVEDDAPLLYDNYQEAFDNCQGSHEQPIRVEIRPIKTKRKRR